MKMAAFASKRKIFKYFKMMLITLVTLTVFTRIGISTASFAIDQLKTGDADHLCTAQAIQDESGQTERMIVSGHIDKVCSYNVTATYGSHISLQAATGRLVDTEFLIVERLGSPRTCDFKYVVFKTTKWSCPVVFAQRNLVIHFRADATLHISATSSEGFRCPQLDMSASSGRDMVECEQLEGYDDVQRCRQRQNRDCDSDGSQSLCWSTDAYCNVDCPSNCTCILNDRHVIFNCTDNDISPQKHVVLLPTNISNLNFSANRITRVEPEAFQNIGTSVKGLDVSLNNLTLYPAIFQHLPNLEVLYLTGCGIKEIEVGMFHSLTNLLELWLNINELDTIDGDIFKGLSSLKVLSLSDNEFVRLGSRRFQDLRNLEVLDLSDNHLNRLYGDTFLGLFTLKSMNLRGNHLENLGLNTFEGLNNLQILNLAENYLVSLKPGVFENLRFLNELYLNGNRKGALQVGLFNGLNRLTILNLQNNFLRSLNDDIFIGMPRITTLDLQRNQLASLQAGLFLGLSSLSHLHLNKNNLSRIDIGAFKGLNGLNELCLDNNILETLDVGVFKGLKNLTILCLDNNRLSSLDAGIFAGLKNVTELHLYNNMLENLDEGLFKGLRKLHLLYLNNNKITTVHVGIFKGLTNLRELHLNNNRLVTLDVAIFNGLSHLTELRLQRNRIERLDVGLFDELNDLDRLSLLGNKLEDLNEGIFNGLHHLTYLHLHKNKLTTLRVGVLNGLNRLTDLYLSNNRLETLEDGVFSRFQNSNLSKLAYLSLASNNLASLPKRVFIGLNSMATLNFDNNSLATIDQNMFDKSNILQTLVLSNNKLQELDFDLFNHFPRLSFLDLSNNALNILPSLGHISNLTNLYIRGNRFARVKSTAFEGTSPRMQVSVDQPEICECYLQHVDNCSATNPLSEYLTCSRLLTNRALLLFMWLLGFCAIFGNALVIYLRKRHFKDKNKVQALLLGNLAMSDLLMGVYMIIMASADVHYGEFFPMSAEIWRTGGLCKLAGTLCITSSEASVMFVTLISIDRFICIKYPYTTRKLHTKSTLKAASFIWVFAFMLGVIPSSLSGLNPDFYDNSHVCIGLPLVQKTIYVTEKKAEQKFNVWGKSISGESVHTTVSHGQAPGMFYSVALFLGFNLLCFLIIFGTYAEIIRTVLRTTKQASRQRDMNEEIRLTGKVAAIVATDFCCWCPIIFTGILVQTGAVTISPVVFAWVVTFILPINSAINPFLYTIADVIANRKQNKEGSQ